MNSTVSYRVGPLGHQDLTLFVFLSRGRILLMFIANLYAKVDFLLTC